MPLTSPVPQTVQMQPKFRQPDEIYQVTITVSWTAGESPQPVVGVRVAEEPDDELRSLVVLPPVEVGGLFGVLDAISHDVLNLVRRTTNPFDDLL